MFLDASVIVAVLAKEPGGDEILKRLDDEGPFFFSPLVRFEAVVSLARKKAGRTVSVSTALLSGAKDAVDGFLRGLGAEEIPISAEIGTLALDAEMRYGKVAGHAAKLNFGDCFAYACAKSLGTKLAYKGNDFAHTDLA
jgi:ribonuclease VapC